MMMTILMLSCWLEGKMRERRGGEVEAKLVSQSLKVGNQIELLRMVVDLY